MLENIITEVIAFKINNKLFATLQDAEKYKFEEIDDVELGDKISIKNFSGGMSDKCGTICCIENDMIYFTLNGEPPEKHLGYIKNGYKNVNVDGRIYNFDIGCHERKNIIRYARKY